MSKLNKKADAAIGTVMGIVIILIIFLVMLMFYGVLKKAILGLPG